MSRHAWRVADTARCGASLVRIAALDGGRALVVGGGFFGPWSIWMDAAQLQRAEERDESALRAVHGMKHPRGAPEPTDGVPYLVQILHDRNNAPNLR
jgi:hypothetical protein